ncbi:MAG: nitronate monooxygenase [Bacteroidales bacterium]|nr:nitronate monooxygenase [Bacteroidales bacterium]MCF8387944.1 nitronate monooxygenase [Bacteroidales bacterium]MCF8399320.1 nitronate monooxygenase [Bacteroidales bacterium]
MKSLKMGNLNIPLPIIQGGMGVGVSLSGLAAAVANEGGVGVISSAGLGLLYKKTGRDYLESSIQGLKEELQKARKLSLGVIGVNVMVAMTNFADMVKTAIAEKADIIFSGAGLPLDLPSFLTKESKTKLVPIVSSERATRIICEKWKKNYDYLPDAIVVEGPKAGGHLGFKDNQIDDEHYSLEQIVPKVITAVKIFEDSYSVKIPVIAAGGIYTGQNIYDILKLGSSGVQLGTRFVTTTECDASDAFKATYINAKAEDVKIINSPVGMPGRAISNAFIDKVKLGYKHPIRCPFKCIKTCDISSSPYCIIKALFSAFKGKFDHGYAFAGTNAYLASKIISVKQTFQDILDEYGLSK